MVVLDKTPDISNPIPKSSLRKASSRVFEKQPRTGDRHGTVTSPVLASGWFLGTVQSCFPTKARRQVKLKTWSLWINHERWRKHCSLSTVLFSLYFHDSSSTYFWLAFFLNSAKLWTSKNTLVPLRCFHTPNYMKTTELQKNVRS